MSLIKRSFFTSLFISLTLSTLLWSSQSIAEDTALPKFSLPTIAPKGKHLTSSMFLGHVSVLHFWASWCGYCRGEHSAWSSINNSTNTPIYSVVLKDDPQAALDWLKTHGNPYTMTASDGDGSLANSLGVYGTPETFIVDKHGKIRYHYTGAISDSTWADTFEPKIKKYLAEK